MLNIILICIVVICYYVLFRDAIKKSLFFVNPFAVNMLFNLLFLPMFIAYWLFSFLFNLALFTFDMIIRYVFRKGENRPNFKGFLRLITSTFLEYRMIGKIARFVNKKAPDIKFFKTENVLFVSRFFLEVFINSSEEELIATIEQFIEKKQNGISFEEWCIEDEE